MVQCHAPEGPPTARRARSPVATPASAPVGGATRQCVPVRPSWARTPEEGPTVRTGSARWTSGSLAGGSGRKEAGSRSWEAPPPPPAARGRNVFGLCTRSWSWGGAQGLGESRRGRGRHPAAGWGRGGEAGEEEDDEQLEEEEEERRGHGGVLWLGLPPARIAGRGATIGGGVVSPPGLCYWHSTGLTTPTAWTCGRDTDRSL